MVCIPPYYFTTIQIYNYTTILPYNDSTIPHKKVPFQFMIQDKNATNVFDNPYKCDNCDKVFDKNLN